ncbi:MAG: hydrogen peroxide-inducible genes activator [Candidatus Pelagadaptatus aseana]|uniref:hydrogen peroxide-inducible genes activator n=1 Tax=Candidatus Pelagadaptatus aseana TaxID=3120508 RepID=UPI0039B1FA82
MITLKQLHYALAVEKTLHFKKAAENCFVSQSALSTALNELEKQLGVQLFERDNKKVLVTPLGRQILQQARTIMLQVDDLQNLAKSGESPLGYPMDIGIIPTIGPYLLPKILPAINQQYPEFQLNVVEEQSHVLVDMVRRGEIDTAILALPYPCEGLLSFEFWQEDFYWVAHSSNQQAGQAEIASKELDQASLMLLKEGHCLKDHILDACKFEQAQSANHGFGATSLNTLIQMVKGQLGTTLVPAMALEQLIAENDQLRAVHLSEPGPHRRIAFLVRPNYSRVDALQLLQQLCREALIES